MKFGLWSILFMLWKLLSSEIPNNSPFNFLVSLKKVKKIKKWQKFLLQSKEL